MASESELTILFDATLHVAPLVKLERDLDRYERDRLDFTDQASPRWVSCPVCGRYRGDRCAGGDDWHRQRVELNRDRLRALKTYAIEVETPCCGEKVFLVWRSIDDLVEWNSVPCFKCAKTFTFTQHASDIITKAAEVERIYPERVEVACWASASADPWKGRDDARRK